MDLISRNYEGFSSFISARAYLTFTLLGLLPLRLLHFLNHEVPLAFLAEVLQHLQEYVDSRHEIHQIQPEKQNC
jgi:hypothetical protein